MSRLGIITTYLSLRLVVRSGFLDIYINVYPNIYGLPSMDPYWPQKWSPSKTSVYQKS